MIRISLADRSWGEESDHGMHARPHEFLAA
jgi:hypothetical protein